MTEDLELNEDEFPGNAKVQRPRVPGTPVTNAAVTKKVVSRVTTENVVQKKPGLLNSFTQAFFGNDAKSVGAYVIWDVLIPAAKNTISEMVSTGIDMILFGETRNRSIRRDKNRSFYNYNEISTRGGRERDRDDVTIRNRSRHRFDDVIIANRAEAEEVLENLVDLIDEYQVATVSDFYDLVGITGSYTDDKYGWTNLSRAEVVRDRHGYIISLPKPRPLD